MSNLGGIKPLFCDYEVALRMRRDVDNDTKELSVYRLIIYSVVSEHFGLSVGTIGEKIANGPELDYEFAVRVTGDHELDAYEICIYREALFDALSEIIGANINLLRNTFISALSS